MNPVQKTGILALGLLIAVAVIGFLLGPNKASAEDGRPDVPVIDIAALPAVEFLPPDRRQFYIAAEDFRQQPIQHPLEGGSGRRISEWEQMPEPDPEAEDPLAQGPVGGAGGGMAVPVPATYKVRENDNLARIAQRELGESGRWREIAALNGLQEPYVLYIGQLLKLPAEDSGPVSEWNAGAPQASSPTPAGGAAAETGAAPKPAPRTEDPEASGGWTTYKVKPNETISEVSMAVYGTSRLWKTILEANGIDDPRKVRAGQTLRIPPRPRS